MKHALVLAALLAAAAPAVAAAQDEGRPVFGAGRGDQDRAREARGRQIPLSRVLAMLASRYPGRHLNTTLGDQGGRPAYYVQWQMADGRVVVFVVDAETGQVVGRQ